MMELALTSQGEISALVDHKACHRLVEATVDVREKARLQCVARDRAGDWLGALPSNELGCTSGRQSSA